jgi:two-component system nitrogen regulation sensor histidine kinase NtrY
MSLRLRFVLYLICVHLLFAGVAVYLLLQHRIWLLAVEAIFVISLSVGYKLIKNLFGTIELLQTGAQFISDGDFTSRFTELGQPEMDALVNVYNHMADHLREQRTKHQEQNYFLEKVLYASPSVIITLDFDDRIAMVNPSGQKMLQLPGKDVLGRKLTELDNGFAQELSELKTGESKVLSLSGRRRVKCHKSQFLDRGFTRDFILIEELTEELRQSEKAAYEKIIRMMSHEVNNTVGSANSLLHSCLNYTDQLTEEDRLDLETALNVVISRTDQLNAFMKSFADVVRLAPPKLYPCDIVRLLEEICFLMRSTPAAKLITWQWDIQTEIEPVMMDRVQMEQVFVNIIKNAIEAVAGEGTITIRIGRQGRRDFVVIEDSGPGIPQSVRSNLFTPFFTTKKNGQGIGLTLIQEILDQHKFEFSLESHVGGPTQFTILLT